MWCEEVQCYVHNKPKTTIRIFQGGLQFRTQSGSFVIDISSIDQIMIFFSFHYAIKRCGLGPDKPDFFCDNRNILEMTHIYQISDTRYIQELPNIYQIPDIKYFLELTHIYQILDIFLNWSILIRYQVYSGSDQYLSDT